MILALQVKTATATELRIDRSIYTALAGRKVSDLWTVRESLGDSLPTRPHITTPYTQKNAKRII